MLRPVGEGSGSLGPLQMCRERSGKSKLRNSEAVKLLITESPTRARRPQVVKLAPMEASAVAHGKGVYLEIYHFQRTPACQQQDHHLYTLRDCHSTIIDS